MRLFFFVDKIVCVFYLQVPVDKNDVSTYLEALARGPERYADHCS